jgi:hypothetical protein
MGPVACIIKFEYCTIIKDAKIWIITLESPIMLLESSITLLESPIILLENIYSTGFTHDDHLLMIVICL